MLHPREVGVAGGRHAVLPAHVFVFHPFVPVLHVEGRIGHDEVGAQVRVLRAGVGAGRLLAEIEIHAPDGHVHRGQAPGGGVGFLPVDRQLPDAPTMLFDKALALHEKAAGAATGVVHPALEGFEHFDDEADDALGRVELAATLAGGNREFAEEAFVDMAEDVLGLERFVLEGHGGQQVDQAGQCFVHAFAGIILVEDVLEPGIFLFDGVEGVVEQAADAIELVLPGLAVLDFKLRSGGDFGVVLDEIPTGQRQYSENVLFGVVVAGFEFLLNHFCIDVASLIAEVVVVGRVVESLFQLVATFLEGIGNVFQEDQAEHHMHVVARGDFGAQAVGGGPKTFVEVVQVLLPGVVHVPFLPLAGKRLFFWWGAIRPRRSGRSTRGNKEKSVGMNCPDGCMCNAQTLSQISPKPVKFRRTLALAPARQASTAHECGDQRNGGSRTNGYAGRDVPMEKRGSPA